MKNTVKALVFTGLSLALNAYGLGVSPMLVYFNSGNNVQDLTVSNADNVVEYAQITLRSLQSPGAENASVVTFQPGQSPQQFGLMVSPNKLAVGPGGSRKIRLVNLAPHPKTDRIYTITVMNINPATKVVGTVKGSAADMNLTYGYQVQVFVLPDHPLPIVSAQRQGEKITITNQGNSYISLRSGQVCDPHGYHCQSLPADLNYHVLYAGSTWSFSLPHPGQVRYFGVYAATQNMMVESN